MLRGILAIVIEERDECGLVTNWVKLGTALEIELIAPPEILALSKTRELVQRGVCISEYQSASDGEAMHTVSLITSLSQTQV
jgi:hypothetical protein